MALVSRCQYCGRNMAASVPCTVATLTIGGEVYERVVFGQEEDQGPYSFSRCPDCAAPLGGLHHLGCDWEQCPRCGGQLLGCGCDVAPVDRAYAPEQSRLQLSLPLEAEAEPGAA